MVVLDLTFVKSTVRARFWSGGTFTCKDFELHDSHFNMHNIIADYQQLYGTSIPREIRRTTSLVADTEDLGCCDELYAGNVIDIIW